MIKTAGDVIGDWVDRMPGLGILGMMLLGLLMWVVGGLTVSMLF